MRHGQSTGNIKHLFNQPATEPLSELGEKQAAQVADRLQDMIFDEMITSDYTRAIQTGEIIRQKLKHPIETHTTPLLRERLGNSQLDGKSWQDAEVQDYMLKVKNAESLDFKEFDEESIGDLIRRAEQLFAYLEARNSKTICIVSHGVFINTLALITTIPKKHITPELRHHFFTHTWTDNTGITIFDEWEPGDWYLISWNDHSHL